MTKLNKPVWTVFIVMMASVLMNSCQVGRFVFYNFADIKDYKKFQSRPLHTDSLKFNFYTTNHGKFRPAH